MRSQTARRLRGRVEVVLAVTADAHGRVLARSDRREGAGLAIADVTPLRVLPADPTPSGFWLHRRAPVATML
jgi:hypothetical protein